MRPIVATVSPAAFAHNIGVARAFVPTAQLHAVVKANAYGHGLDRLRPGFDVADGLAVIELENAIHVRADLAWTKPLMVLEGFYSPEELALFSQHGIDAVIHTIEQIVMLERAALPARIGVYLKLNSGMNRLGFPLAQARSMHARLLACANVREVILTTHFARGDEPEGYRTQLDAFHAATAGLPGRRSIANSGATVQGVTIDTDIARAGIMLYGGTPLEGRSAASFGLKAVMTLTSKVIAIQHVRAGETVGYGGVNVAPRDMRIAVIAGGYADGYLRSARNGTPVLIDGVRAPLFGRVSMDKITVDASNVPTPQVGSHVEFWGEQLPVDEVAAHCGTIAYELLCGVTARVPFRVV
jgi:alanine racemase